MLLAKLYINAEVYTGAARYADAMTYINNVIGGGYSLGPEYNYLFLAELQKLEMFLLMDLEEY